MYAATGEQVSGESFPAVERALDGGGAEPPTRFKVYEISATDNPLVSTVLVVDDEPIVRDVVLRHLERDSYRTLQAASGDETRDVLEREPPSLVVHASSSLSLSGRVL